ncbi:CAA Xprenyl protease [Schizosaccharomyces japonicus yFS275]|uniref:intramembrane prenyl-peptidase Rce1 n=1 Tax=Schizosaccharomyces japonicus (strain yFS275 / FY16936) TaxID=402676 RepID=B6JWF4_SCHJY|nr:CAA Xprenyl protease [Schizosaccharomyces japonicus yFS275]EEB05705.1 CAA Xprenyl protease [Schizosaccharomyces japonicus yFS275]
MSLFPLAFGAVQASIYVASLYIFPAGRPSPTFDRNATKTVAARCCSVIIASVASTCLAHFVLTDSNNYWKVNLIDISKAIFHAMIFFLGPLYEVIVVQQGYRTWKHDLTNMIKEPTEWRNLVLGPLSEEVTFRRGIVPACVSSGWSNTRTIFLAPVLFGLAHVHHMYEFLLQYPKAYVVAIVRSFIQFSYTSVFGWYVTYLFLQTKSIWPPFLVHAFSNYMGLPRFFGYLPLKKQTVYYYTLLVSGVVAFFASWDLFWSKEY